MWEAPEQVIIGKAVDLLSGPGGLASFLRRRQLGARLAGPSLPLDIGYSETIPAGIRNAVMLRDKHCQWALADTSSKHTPTAWARCRLSRRVQITENSANEARMLEHLPVVMEQERTLSAVAESA